MQRIDVHDVSLSNLTPVTIAYNVAAICEQASPAPAMQLQCAHIIVPLAFSPIHGNKGGLLIRWLCFTYMQDM